MLPPPPLPPSPSFYKRPLPDTCVRFESQKGKELFGKALREGGMESYFPLAAQVRLYSLPFYCGWD